MGKFYVGLIITAAISIFGSLAVIASRRKGISQGEARGKAKEAIDRIQDAVNRGDDAEVQRPIEEKVHGKP